MRADPLCRDEPNRTPDTRPVRCPTRRTWGKLRAGVTDLRCGPNPSALAALLRGGDRRHTEDHGETVGGGRFEATARHTGTLGARLPNLTGLGDGLWTAPRAGIPMWTREIRANGWMCVELECVAGQTLPAAHSTLDPRAEEQADIVQYIENAHASLVFRGGGPARNCLPQKKYGER